MTGTHLSNQWTFLHPPHFTTSHDSDVCWCFSVAVFISRWVSQLITGNFHSLTEMFPCPHTEWQISPTDFLLLLLFVITEKLHLLGNFKLFFLSLRTLIYNSRSRLKSRDGWRTAVMVGDDDNRWFKNLFKDYRLNWHFRSFSYICSRGVLCLKKLTSSFSYNFNWQKCPCMQQQY